MRNQLPSSEMEYNPYCAQIDPKVANALEKIGFKRNKCLANQWVRIRWYWPFSSELVVLGLVGEWMYDNGHGTRYWSAAYDDLFECINKGWV